MASTNDLVAGMESKLSAIRYLVNREYDIGTRYSVNMSLGDRVRKARRAKGLTQVQLVAAVKKRGGDLSQPQLSAIEKDEVDRPGSLYEIAAVLGTTAAELLGKPLALRTPASEGPTLPVSSMVSAGDEVIQPIDSDGPFDREPAPPDLLDGEVAEIRGRSMLPVFADGDRLFFRTVEDDPARLIGGVVVARLRDGRRFVKILRAGSRRGRFNLESINPQYDEMIDQQLDAVGEIVWVRKKARPAKPPSSS